MFLRLLQFILRLIFNWRLMKYLMQELNLLMNRLPLSFNEIRSGSVYLECKTELRRDLKISIEFSRRLLLFLLMVISYLIGGLKAHFCSRSIH